MISSIIIYSNMIFLLFILVINSGMALALSNKNRKKFLVMLIPPIALIICYSSILCDIIKWVYKELKELK